MACTKPHRNLKNYARNRVGKRRVCENCLHESTSDFSKDLHEIKSDLAVKTVTSIAKNFLNQRGHRCKKILKQKRKTILASELVHRRVASQLLMSIKTVVWY